MRLERRLLNLEREAESLMGSFELSNGTVYRYGSEEVREAFGNFFERVCAEVDGKPDPGAHPFIGHLRRAKDGELGRLVEKEGSLVEMMQVEDAVFRGEKVRSGRPEGR